MNGTCFGYEVVTELDLHYLRSGGGVDELRVTVWDRPPEGPLGAPLLSWSPPTDPFDAALYARDGSFHLRVDATDWFRIDPEAGHISVPSSGRPVRREERLWGLPALLCFVRRGHLPLHGAAFEVDGRAVVVAAEGRSGKTTLAAAAATAGYRVLAEDLVCLRTDGATPAVVPGPAALRLRPDVADRVRPADAVELHRSRERVHLALAPATRGTCAPVPVATVVLLTQPGTPLGPLSATEGVAALWSLSFKLPTEDDRVRAFDSLVALAARVPFERVHRSSRLETLPATLDTLADLTRRPC